MEIRISSKFEKKFKKICKSNPRLARKVNEKLEDFIKNPSNPKNRLHKLSGFLEPTWSVSITTKVRLLFIFGDNEILLTNIGSHGEVY